MAYPVAVLAALAIVALPSPALADPAPDEAAWLYEPDQVVSIDLNLPQESIDALEAEPDEYVTGTFALEAGGKSFGPLEVGVRLKGQGSFRTLAQKAAFKLKFDEYVEGQRFQGLKKMTLNNMVQDPSMIHESLAYEAFRAAGVPAPRTGYAYVTVNGEDYGVYLDIEVLDKISLPRWFASTRHLCEAGYQTDVVPEDIEGFEADEGKSAKREDIEALIAAANDDEGDWSDGMAGLADLDEMTRMWAVERYIGHWDGYSLPTTGNNPNNYYLHSEESGLFRMIPWGTDQTWEDHPDFDAGSNGVLFQRCLADQSCAAMYRQAVEDANSAIGALDIGAQASALAILLAPYQALDPRQKLSPDEVEQDVEGTKDFISSRPAEVAEWLDSPPGEEEPTGPPELPPPIPKSPVAPLASTVVPASPKPSNKLVLGAVVRRTSGSALKVRVPGAGKLALSGRGLKPVTATAASAGRVELMLRTTAEARRKLGRTGAVTLRATVTFTPAGGDPAARSRSFRCGESEISPRLHRN